MMSRTLVSLAVLSLISVGMASGCKSQGTMEGNLSTPKSHSASKAGDTGKDLKQKPATAQHEHVSFTWESTHGPHSGKIQTTLPDGESFSGQFHEITSGTTVATLDGFYRSWYGGPWSRYDWTWGGDWPYYDYADEYITYYTNRVVAILDGDRGTTMRCNFKLDDPSRGMKGGGQGDCQLSTGERITAVFAAI